MKDESKLPRDTKKCRITLPRRKIEHRITLYIKKKKKQRSEDRRSDAGEMWHADYYNYGLMIVATIA